MTPAQMINIRCTVNGQPWEGAVEPATVLLDLLRDQLGLTGAKRGCERLACGACTVLVDGRPVSACGMLAADVEGSAILTVEGLPDGGVLTCLQRAFVDKVAAQCGYCTPGQLMSATALIQGRDRLRRDQIRAWMQGNLCRCGSYAAIVEAIEVALAQPARHQTASHPTACADHGVSHHRDEGSS